MLLALLQARIVHAQRAMVRGGSGYDEDMAHPHALTAVTDDANNVHNAEVHIWESGAYS